MIESKANERWPMIAPLAGLGWKLSKIAEAIGWSEATVINDLNSRGGFKNLFPNHPNGALAVYAATFRFYTDHRGEESRVMAAVESLLQIGRIVEFVEGMERTYFVLSNPCCPPELESYANFVFFLQNDVWRIDQTWSEKNDSEVWQKYLDDISSGQCDAPNSVAQATEQLLKRFTSSCDRNRLFSSLPDGLRELIDGWLADEEQITPRERLVITTRFGLAEKKSTSLSEIAKDMGVCVERVRQIETKVLHKLRSQWRMDELKDFFLNFGELTERNRRLTEEIVELKAAQVALYQRNVELGKAARAGCSTEVLFEIEEQVNWIALVPNLIKRFDRLGLTIRTFNCLLNLGLESVGQLVQISEPEMLKTRNFGHRSLDEIKKVLGKLGGLRLNMDLPPALAARFVLPAHFNRMLEYKRKLPEELI